MLWDLLGKSVFKYFEDILNIHIDFKCPDCKNAYRLFTRSIEFAPSMSCKCGYKFIVNTNNQEF